MLTETQHFFLVENIVGRIEMKKEAVGSYKLIYLITIRHDLPVVRLSVNFLL
jgi:hypothetical protein